MVSRSEVSASSVRRNRSRSNRSARLPRAWGSPLGASHTRESPLGECVDFPSLTLARASAFASEGGRILLDERSERRIGALGLRRKTGRILHAHELSKLRAKDTASSDSVRLETTGNARPGGAALTSIYDRSRHANKEIQCQCPWDRELRC